jgi:hypothetical protein
VALPYFANVVGGALRPAAGDRRLASDLGLYGLEDYTRLKHVAHAW